MRSYRNVFMRCLPLLLASGLFAQEQTPPSETTPATVMQPDSAAMSEEATGPVAVPEPGEKAMRYYRSGNVLWLANLFWGLLIPALFLFTGFSARIRNWAQKLGRKWFFVIGIYFVIFTNHQLPHRFAALLLSRIRSRTRHCKRHSLFLAFDSHRSVRRLSHRRRSHQQVQRAVSIRATFGRSFLAAHHAARQHFFFYHHARGSDFYALSGARSRSLWTGNHSEELSCGDGVCKIAAGEFGQPEAEHAVQIMARYASDSGRAH